MASNLLVNNSKLPPRHQAILLRVSVIGEAHSDKINGDITAKYKKLISSLDVEMLVEFCLHTGSHWEQKKANLEADYAKKMEEFEKSKEFLVQEVLEKLIAKLPTDIF